MALEELPSRLTSFAIRAKVPVEGLPADQPRGVGSAHAARGHRWAFESPMAARGAPSNPRTEAIWGMPVHRTRMPRDKRDPAAREPSPYEDAGSEAINAMVARTAPAVLELLADGVPRSKPAIVEALTGRHARPEFAVSGHIRACPGQPSH